LEISGKNLETGEDTESEQTDQHQLARLSADSRLGRHLGFQEAGQSL